MFEEILAGFLLLAAAEEHAVGHDGGHFAIGFEDGEHVLDEHEVGLFAFFRQPDGETAGIFGVFADVVLAEGRIGQDAVEAGEFAGLGFVLGTAEGVFLADIGGLDAMEKHVHFADGPGGTDAFLAGEREVAGIGAAVAKVVAGLDEHAAGAAGGIVDGHAGLGIDDFDEGADDVGGRVEFTGFLAGGIGEELDEVFVSRAEEVGEFEIFVAEGDFFEVLDEVGERVVVERALADFAVEVDVLEDVLEGVGVVVFEIGEGFVELVADVRLEMAQVGPMGGFGNPEGVFVGAFEFGGDLIGREVATGGEGLGKALAFLVEEVAEPFEE